MSASLTAAIAELARVETVLARQRQRAAAGLAAADGCLADVVSVIPAGWDFAPLLAGPDGIAGSGDDGTLVAPAGCVASVRAAPGPPTPARTLVTITGTGDGGRRALDALLARAPRPGVPALLWFGGPPTGVAVAGSLALDGTDATDPLAPPLAGIAAAGPADAIDGWLAAEAAHVPLAAGTPSARSATPPPLAALGQRLAALGAADPSRLPAAGTRPGGLAHVGGDLRVDAPFSGAGILFVGGILDIRAPFDFTGLVVASGGLAVAAGINVRVGGAIWCAGSVAMSGVAALRQDRAALDDVDRQVSLPRLAVATGIKDL